MTLGGFEGYSSEKYIVTGKVASAQRVFGLPGIPASQWVKSRDPSAVFFGRA